MRTLRLILLGFAVLATATCAQSPTEPHGIPGRYRLVSVNGFRLPFEGVNAQGWTVLISGDLNLRPNSTYGFGIQALPILIWDEGIWGVAGGRLNLTSTLSELSQEFEVLGDSIVVRYPSEHLTLTFKRSETTGTPLHGAYAMTALMGDPDRRYEWSRWEYIGPEFVQVQYDTIRFIDDVFFWRSRSVTSGRVSAGGVTFHFGSFGAYDSRNGVLELRHLGNMHTLGSADSLSVTPNQLERVQIRHDLFPSSLEWRETYTRVE